MLSIVGETPPGRILKINAWLRSRGQDCAKPQKQAFSSHDQTPSGAQSGGVSCLTSGVEVSAIGCGVLSRVELLLVWD